MKEVEAKVLIIVNRENNTGLQIHYDISKGGFSPLVSESQRQLRSIFVDDEKSFVSKSATVIARTRCYSN